MSKRILIAALLAGFGVSTAVPMAEAQSVRIGPGGVQISPFGEPYWRGGRYEEPRWRRDRDRISQREAIRLARRYGMADIDRVVRAGERWRIRGEDRRGRDLRIVVHDNGRVVIDRS